MGVLKNLTEEYFGKKIRGEDTIEGVKYNHSFKDNKGKLHKNGYYIEDGNYKTLQKLVGRLIKERFKSSYVVVDLNDIDVSNMTCLKSIFGYEHDESGNLIHDCFHNVNFDIGGWDVSHVTDMTDLFSGCSYFNRSLSKWDVSNLKIADYMFQFCSSFKQDLSKWKITRKLKRAPGMFSYCDNFNSDISGWDVFGVNTMYEMFFKCKNFNKDLSGWNINHGCYVRDMFKDCNIKQEYIPELVLRVMKMNGHI